MAKMGSAVLLLLMLAGCEKGTANAFDPSFSSNKGPDVEIPALTFCMTEPWQAEYFGYPVCAK
jgi:hypothetical protein